MLAQTFRSLHFSTGQRPETQLIMYNFEYRTTPQKF